jgi:hypothetical protein
MADMPFCIGYSANLVKPSDCASIVKKLSMTNVTVLFLDQTFSSTATGPMEVFRHTGTLWNNFTGQKSGLPLSRNHGVVAG